MRKIRVGLLSFSDGRTRVHSSLAPYISQCEDALRSLIERDGEAEVITAPHIIDSSAAAKENACYIKVQLPDVVVFNVCVFAFPSFVSIAARVLGVPLAVVGAKNGSYPGLGGLLAATNLLEQSGIPYEKLWGALTQEDIGGRLSPFLRAAFAASQLNGQVFGLIGGRSIGIGSGVAPADQWMSVFGVDVDHADQLEIIRMAQNVEDAQAQRGLEWLEASMTVCYDGRKLTRESLLWQIRCYCATYAIARQRGFDFVGVKCHYDLSEYYCTQCLSAALFNDPYDWNGPKDTMVYSCEGDADGALTMQILKLLTGLPVLFFDFRHYDEEEALYYFCNCGAMTSWYAAPEDHATGGLKNVALVPVVDKYAGCGCHVQFIAKPMEMTFARLTHGREGFTMTVFTGRSVPGTPNMAEATCVQWPHLFVRADAGHEKLMEGYLCNHVHGVAGKHVEALRHFCALKGVAFNYIQGGSC